MKGETIFILAMFVILSTPFFWNGYKLFNCDFESNYKCEVIHGVGLAIPPLSVFTVWFDDDSNKESK